MASTNFESAYFFVDLGPSTKPIGEAIQLEEKAQENLRLIFSKIPRHVKRPAIRDLYLETAGAIVKTIPADIQLPYLFYNFEDIIRARFTVWPDDMAPQVIRTIFYWGMDPRHSFWMGHEVIRYNIVVTAYIWVARSLGLDTSKYCDEEAFGFARAFMQAWFSSVVSGEDFAARDEFLALYSRSKYDLACFPGQTREHMRLAVDGIKYRVPPPQADLEEFVEACARGKATRDEVEKFVPQMAVYWSLKNQSNWERIIQDGQVKDRALKEWYQATARLLKLTKSAPSPPTAEYYEQMDVLADAAAIAYHRRNAVYKAAYINRAKDEGIYNGTYVDIHNLRGVEIDDLLDSVGLGTYDPGEEIGDAMSSYNEESDKAEDEESVDTSDQGIGNYSEMKAKREQAPVDLTVVDWGRPMMHVAHLDINPNSLIKRANDITPSATRTSWISAKVAIDITNGTVDEFADLFARLSM